MDLRPLAASLFAAMTPPYPPPMMIASIVFMLTGRDREPKCDISVPPVANVRRLVLPCVGRSRDPRDMLLAGWPLRFPAALSGGSCPSGQLDDAGRREMTFCPLGGRW